MIVEAEVLPLGGTDFLLSYLRRSAGKFISKFTNHQYLH